MTQTTRDLTVMRGRYRLHVDLTPGSGPPIVLMHGFPDNTHLYDGLVPHLAGGHPVVRFDFLGWGQSDKPERYPYTAAHQTGDLAAVIDGLSGLVDTDEVIVVAHDASGPPAIDWALENQSRVAGLVLLNTYYHWIPALRRPPAIALYSTPGVRAMARAIVRRRPDLDRRLYSWQVGKFIQDPDVRRSMVARLYADFLPARPAFWRLNDDLLGTVVSRRKRLDAVSSFAPPVRIVFGARDRYLNPGVARAFSRLFPDNELHLLPDAGHYVQVDEPVSVAEIITRPWRRTTQ